MDSHVILKQYFGYDSFKSGQEETGNIKHFPSDTFIVTPRQFIEMLNEKMM